MAMNNHERMLRALRGEPVDRIPWAPRMDLWYIALRERRTAPQGLEDANIVDIARHFGFAVHAVRSDSTLPRPREASMFRGLGYENHPDYAFRFELTDLPCTHSVEGDEVTTSVETSHGPVSFRLRYTSGMRADGISQPFKLSYPVEEPEDLDRVAELFEHMRVVPTPETYRAFHDRIGDDGLAVAHGSISASPIHLLLHELMRMDRFYFWYHDRYTELKRFEERMTPFFDRIIDAVAGAGAEAVLWGANFDRDLTWPPFFDRDIAPWLVRVRDRLHAAGSLLLCHTDGENAHLFPSYSAVGFDIAESLCTSPMTELSLVEQRRGFGDEVCIWGGIPSVALLSDSFSESDFRGYLDSLDRDLAEIAPAASRMIFGVSDNVPPDADLSRLNAIGEWISAHRCD